MKNNSNRRYLDDLLFILLLSIFLGFLTPFGMHQEPLYLSISYWMLVCIFGYSIYMPLLRGAKRLFSSSIWQLTFSAVIASLIMASIVPLISNAFFSYKVSFDEQFFPYFSKSLVIGLAISILTILKRDFIDLKQELSNSQQKVLQQKTLINQNENKGLEQLIQKIPIDKRGELYCLQMSDHYLNVYTDKGNHLLLMRFKDALILLNKASGLQTHRSWWVAKDAVVKRKRIGRKYLLVLKNDLEVPVSKTFEGAVKAENLI